MTVVEAQRPADSRAPDATDELRVCDTPMCQQAIARVKGSSIFPLVPKVYAEDGSLMIVCSLCGRRHRFAVRRQAA